MTAAWWSDAAVQQAITELYTLALNVVMDVWGPAPVAPAQIRPAR